MGVFETGLAVILTAAVILVMSRQRISRWFPQLTQLQVAIAVAGVYVAAGFGIAMLFLTDTSICNTAKTGVLIREFGNPLIEEPQTVETREAGLSRQCQSYFAECQIDGGETTSRVDEICAPYN